MPSPTPRLILCAAYLILFAGLCETFLPLSEARMKTLQDGVTVSSKNVGGTIEVTIDATRYGNIKVYLPDDMRAGDTISGTLVTEPKGNTPEEKAKNKSELENYRVGVGSETVSVTEAQFTFKTREVAELPAPKLNILNLAVLAPNLGTTPLASQPPRNFIIDGANIDIPLQAPGKVNGGTTTTFFPLLSQQGRAAEILGSFDGNLANTGLTRPQIGENSGGPIRVLAESPRKIVFVAPQDVTGPYSINVKEGDKTFTGNSRNVAVRLSAPKLNLLRGERTTVTIEVSGLAGIINDVPLQLDARGVINMDGGNFQNLKIKPEEVKLDGRYTTNRAINALQAGGFSVTATVIVGPFDVNLQDDTDPNRLFHFNSFTGDYMFACGGGSCRSGSGETNSQPPAGSSAPPPPVTLTGIGKPAMKGCIITLSHNAPDRRVFARLDACTKTGDASVETKSPKANFNITDKNTTDNTTSPPPPK